MKVVQVMPEFGLAGAETMCENLILELVKRNVDVIVISLYQYHSAITDRLEKKNIRIYYLDKEKGLDLRMIKKLYHVLKQEQPDVIHTHRYVMQYAIPAAVLAGVKKRIHTVHSVATKEVTPLAQKLHWFFYHWNQVVPVALSDEIKETIEERYHLHSSRIPVIYNGIDLSKCIVKHNYVSNERIRFLHIGRFSLVKNHQMLIEAYGRVQKRYPGTELVLIGTGELEEKVKENVRKMDLSDHVIFLGLKESVFEELNAADVFVLPSLYEGMPMTIAEAMGTGLPVIASRVGGIPSMITQKEDGLLIDVNVDALTNAMCKMMDPTLRRQLGQRARKSAERMFSARTMCDGYYELYSSNEILEDGGLRSCQYQKKK